LEPVGSCGDSSDPRTREDRAPRWRRLKASALRNAFFVLYFRPLSSRPLKKLILKCPLAPGDIVMLTAAVRDLHRACPGRFVTDVRTSCPELWEHNPHLTPLADDDPEAELIECSYPLIDRCNEAPYHCLHGFIEFLNERLDLRCKPTLFKGDIHLSLREKAWHSQVRELTRQEIPFWIIGSGGKYDATPKWWPHERHQAVVDHFRNRIQFVQVGAVGHYHPKLKGVIDLRGQTNLRELVRLVYHSQGILCHITSLMHLAAAVETKPGQPRNRPCVVVAGGREPVHWEAYPDHQFVATNGLLSCCSAGGCWRSRTIPLGDGDYRDKPEHLCLQPVGDRPLCMDMISAGDVIRRIEGYFDGGRIDYLAPGKRRAARRGVQASQNNEYDDSPLTLHNARLACERFIRALPAPPRNFHGRGIVICGGGVSYFTNAWVCINMLRRLGCSLPIQLWHKGPDEMDEPMKALVRPLGVECVDALKVVRKHPARRLGGWELKPYAIIHSSFQEVLLLDADNVPVANPESLFATPQYRATGAIFWPDFKKMEKIHVLWASCGLEDEPGQEFESGQIVVDKKRCWEALRLALWFNEQSDFYYQHIHGDKETFHLAFHKMRKSYGMIDTPIHPLESTMCQHNFKGRRLFQHRNTDKWNLFLRNKVVPDFWFEAECREFIVRLRDQWDGRSGRYLPARKGGRSKSKGRGAHPSIQACMISCAERETVRAETLRRLAATDWGEEPVAVQVDAESSTSRSARQLETAFLALQNGLRRGADYILFLEDDLDFNHHLRHNLFSWSPVRAGAVTLAGLYSPRLRERACHVDENWSVIAPHSIFGSQAFLISSRAAHYFVRHWNEVEGLQDIKMSRLAGRLKRPLYYHTPSLIQHVGRESLWGGGFHQAPDFDPLWKA